MTLSAPPDPARPLTALFDITNRCNIRCRMCYFRFDSVFHRREELLSPEDFERIASQVLPRAHTAYLSAGSEPLLSPHFAEILAIARRYAPLRTKALTNGLLLTPELDEALIELGLDELHVSIDGARPETYESIRSGGRFDRLVENLARLTDRKRAVGSPWPLLQFNITLMRSNIEELEEFVPLARELGVERIACRHLMPYVGLGLEDETTDRDPLGANRRFARFLDRACSAGVRVTSFPDFFPVAGAGWRPAAEPSGASEGRVPVIGHVDLPDPRVRETHPVGGVARLEGWALASRGVEEVVVDRRSRVGWTRLGRATIHNGTRPDVQAIHAGYPQTWRAGWSFELPEADVPADERDDVPLRVVAVDPLGGRAEVGRVRVAFRSDSAAMPFRFCRKPFETIYVTSSGDVYPYPDCQTIDPIGSLLGDGRFEDVWRAPRLERLREQIEARRPPTMCLTCPDFINRHPDDPAFFREREVEFALRRPTGFLDAPSGRVHPNGEPLDVTGWALAFSPIEAVELRRDATDDDVPDAVRADGTVRVAGGEPSGLPRPDVARLHRRYPNAERAGFSFRVDPDELLGASPAVHLRVVARCASGEESVLGSFALERPERLERSIA